MSNAPIIDKPNKRVSFTLKKEERLTRKRIIEDLHENGKAIKSPAIVLVYLPVELPVKYPAQAMFTVSKRIFKRAHDRNRVKRLLREAYRKQKQQVYDALESQQLQAAVMIIFTGRQLPNYPYIHGKLGELMKRLTQELITHKNTPKT